ncbi:MAG: aminoacyl-tRNA hydrolase [Propionibacteriales bacterium]|nr:aminoacyl-tRNA hydrolase [Propionibacteriales bacterium]
MVLRVRNVEIPESEIKWRFSRSSGPGGQSVNTSDSRVEAVFDLAASPSVPSYLKERALKRLRRRLVDGTLAVTASEHRSQHRNRQSARARLADILEDAFGPPPPKRRPTRPTRGSQERRIAGKKRRAETKAQRRRPDA